MPRPSLRCSDEVIAKVCESLRRGHSRNVAAAKADISMVEFEYWYNTGASSGKGKYYEFYTRVRDAEMEGLERLETMAIEGAEKSSANAIRYIKERYDIWSRGQDESRPTTIIIKPTFVRAPKPRKKRS